MQTLLSTAEVAAMSGVLERSVHQWVQAGLIVPSRIGHVGRGAHHGFGVDAVLAVVLARDLRKRGFSLTEAGVVLDWLRARSTRILTAQFKRGQRFMIVVNDSEPFPRLMTRAEVFDNPEIDFVGASLLGCKIAVLDIQKAFELVSQKLASLHAHKKPEAVIA